MIRNMVLKLHKEFSTINESIKGKTTRTTTTTTKCVTFKESPSFPPYHTLITFPFSISSLFSCTFFISMEPLSFLLVFNRVLWDINKGTKFLKTDMRISIQIKDTCLLLDLLWSSNSQQLKKLKALIPILC